MFVAASQALLLSAQDRTCYPNTFPMQPDCCRIRSTRPGLHTVSGLAFDPTGCRTLVHTVNPTALFLPVCYPWGNLCPNNLRFPKEQELPALLSSWSDSKEYREILLFISGFVFMYPHIKSSVKITSLVCKQQLLATQGPSQEQIFRCKG